MSGQENGQPPHWKPGIEWGTVQVGGLVLRAYMDRANGTISYLRPPDTWRVAAFALADTFRGDTDDDARQVTA